VLGVSIVLRKEEASAPKSRGFVSSQQSHLIALEPRMMFDGAALPTTVELALDASGNDVFAPVSVVLPTIESKMTSSSPSRTMIDSVFGFARESKGFASLGVDDGAGSDQSARPYAIETAALGLAFGVDTMVPLSAAATTDIIFIDTSITDYQTLAAEWSGKGTIVLIDSQSDGIDQIRTALAGKSDIGAIHIVSHGDEGVFWLGTTRIDQAAVAGELASSFAAIGAKLSAGGDILIYGCDVGAGTAGQGLIDLIAVTSGADVAASIDDTGAILRGGDWTLENRLGVIDATTLVAERWEGLLATALISINPATTVLKVFDTAGVEVANSTSGAGFTAGQAVGVSAGGFAVWSNAGTVGGQIVDLRAVLVTSTLNGATPDTISFNRPAAGTNDPGFLLRSATGTGTASIQVRWELVLTGTNTPIAADISYTIADIDGTGANAAAGALLNAPTRESVVVSTDTLSSFQSAAVTDIKFNTGTPGAVTAFGTVNELAAPPLPVSAARFNWINTSNWVITYNLNRAAAAQAGFNHDGNNEFAFGAGGVTTSIPRLDLDVNDSTAPGSGAIKTFLENGAAVSITDTDPLVTNPIGTVQRATVTLTNAQLGDVLSVGTLATGLSATVDNSVAGQVTVNITGAATAAQYAAAFQAIAYRNTTERPGTADRIINTSYSNGTFSSNVAVSTIKVIEVNDAPTAVNDGPLTTAEDTPITGINVLANDFDGEAVAPTTGDPLTVTTATATNGTVTIGAGGLLTYTPNLNFNGTDTITYTISDGRGGTSTATIPITITAVNDAPTPVGSLPPRANVDAATGISVPTASAFADVDNATLTYSVANLPLGLSINATTGVISGTIDRSASLRRNCHRSRCCWPDRNPKL
jgi:large repetitive protein